MSDNNTNETTISSPGPYARLFDMIQADDAAKKATAAAQSVAEPSANAIDNTDRAEPAQ
jgi:hypothetical protein